MITPSKCFFFKSLTAADTEGFTTIRKKAEAEIARAEARGQEVSGEVYQETMVAAAEGMASVNSVLDTQYDKEFGEQYDRTCLFLYNMLL
ncbi:MAG: hypothetical protein K5852_07480 [Eubacterium sp.]|nr:hypothetical protein [Eubacterium sp.]